MHALRTAFFALAMISAAGCSELPGDEHDCSAPLGPTTTTGTDPQVEVGGDAAPSDAADESLASDATTDGQVGDRCVTTVRANLISCSWGTPSSGGSIVHGASGAGSDNAGVTVTPVGSSSVNTGTCDGSGGFDVPIVVGNGTEVQVTIQAPGCDPVTVSVLCN